jgi:hypothetical protein
MDYASLEDKLFKALEDYQGIEDQETRLRVLATNEGLKGTDLDAVVSHVLERLTAPEKDKTNGKLGKGHNPNSQLVSIIKELKY